MKWNVTNLNLDVMSDLKYILCRGFSLFLNNFGAIVLGSHDYLIVIQLQLMTK